MALPEGAAHALGARYISKPYPAETAVGVAELGIPGALLEIRATAVLG